MLRKGEGRGKWEKNKEKKNKREGEGGDLALHSNYGNMTDGRYTQL